MSKRQARRVLAVEVPAASAKVAAAEAAKVAAPEAAHVAEAAAGESSSAAPEAVTVASTVAAIVTRTPSIAVTIVRVPRTVVAGAGTIGRPVVIAAAIIWIARGRAKDAADDSGSDGRAGVVAISVGVAMPVAPYVMMAVRVRDAAIGMPGPAVDRMC